MAKFYPHKQTIVIFVVCFALVAVAFYFSSWGSVGEITANSNGVSSINDSPEKNSQMGTSTLSDWKKQFVGDTKTFNEQPTSTISTEKLTQTERLSRDFFTQYLNLQQANLLNDSASIDKTADSLINTNISATAAKTYTSRDLHLIKTSDPVILKNFSVALAQILDTYKITKGESTIVQEFIDKPDPNILKQIDPIIATYKSLVKQLLELPTPEVVATHEVGLINAFSQLEASAEDLRVMNKDSVRGLAGISTHIAGAKEIIGSIKGLYDTLKSLGVTFELNQEMFNVLLK